MCRYPRLCAVISKGADGNATNLYTMPVKTQAEKRIALAGGAAVVDLTRDMAAEEEARISYEYLINQTNDQSILDPLIFLREREIVHYQRFGEALVKVRDLPNCKVYL